MTLNAVTLDDVREAKAALEARGETPSGNKVLAAIGHGSKKTVLKHLRILAGAPGAPPSPPASRPAAAAPPPPLAAWARFAEYHQQQQAQQEPPPVPARDPVTEAEAALDEAREAMQQQTAREAWVQQHRPELVAELQRAEQTYAAVQKLPDDAQKPRAHYAARFVLQQARQMYQTALAQAPTTNGHNA